MIHSARADSSFLQLEEGDFGRAIEPDRRRDQADAAADVHMGVLAGEQAVGVFASILRGDEWGAVKGDHDLTAVGMAGEDQVRTRARPILERVGVVHHHEGEGRVDARERFPDIDTFGPVIAEADDGERFAVDADGLAGVAEDGDADGLDGVGDGIAVVPVIVITEAGEHAVFGAGLAQAADAIADHLGGWSGFLEQSLDQPIDLRMTIRKRMGYGQVIAGEDHEVGSQSISGGDTFGYVMGADEAAAVEIGEVGDGEARKRGRKSLDCNREASDVGEAGFDESGVDNASDTDEGGGPK